MSGAACFDDHPFPFDGVPDICAHLNDARVDLAGFRMSDGIVPESRPAGKPPSPQASPHQPFRSSDRLDRSGGDIDQVLRERRCGKRQRPPLVDIRNASDHRQCGDRDRFGLIGPDRFEIDDEVCIGCGDVQ